MISAGAGFAPDHGGAPKLGYWLAAAILVTATFAGSLTGPTSLLLARLFGPSPPPMAPATSRPVAPAQRQGPPLGLGNPASAPHPTAPAAPAPVERPSAVATVPPPPAMPSAPTPNASRAVAAPPDASADRGSLPGALGLLDANPLGGPRSKKRAPLDAHAAVQALLKSMAHPKGAAHRVSKAGGTALRAPRAGAGAPPRKLFGVDLAELRDARPAGLGGPVPFALVGLNGTSMHHRP